MTHALRFISLLALSLVLLTAGCGSGSGSNGDSRLNLRAPLQEGLRPARPDATHAPVLVECARLFDREGDNEFTPCTLERLPLLGMSDEPVTTEAILERTVVSHDWMARRFEQALQALPDDLIQLFGGVTAVVIGSDIRPSYYWLSTGAIYLDPSRLWLTLGERNTISSAPDYRSEFGQSLNYESLNRYVRDGSYAWVNAPLTGSGEDRSLDAILAPLAALLFHELAHANDYVPPAEQTNLEPGQRLGEAATELQSDSVSATLASTYPLTSELMMDLAEVRFDGREANDSETALTPEDVGLEFALDGASDDYAYVTTASRELFLEDTAMLFEEAMMQHHFGVSRDIAFTDRPDSDDASCDNYIVRWGERGRVGHNRVRPRLALILPLLLDRNNIADYLESLPAAQSLVTGLGWCANLDATAQGRHSEPGARAPGPLPEEDRRQTGGERPHHPQY